MADVSGVNNAQGRVTPAQGQGDASAEAVRPLSQPGVQPEGSATPVGPSGPQGQPVGLPVPAPKVPLMPDALVGRDPSQLVAAEQLRTRGSTSATEELLGLNRQPTVVGALAAPPGNAEALRHMTPTMRRTLMRNLLDKQRTQMRRLAQLMRRERDGRGDDEEAAEDERRDSAFEAADALVPADGAQRERARAELGSAARMLDLLDELLAMQDYAVSQMGTFAQG